MRQKRKNREGKWGKNALFNFPEPGKILDYTCWLEMKHFSFLPWIEKHWGFFNCQFEELQRVFCGKYVKEPSNFILHISVFQHNISVKIAKSFKRNWLERISRYGWIYISPYLHDKFNFQGSCLFVWISNFGHNFWPTRWKNMTETENAPNGFVKITNVLFLRAALLNFSSKCSEVYLSL